MKADKVKALDTAELQNQLKESGEQIFRLKFQMKMGQTDGLKKYRELKKDKARILTVLRERNVKPEANPAPAPSKSSKKGKK